MGRTLPKAPRRRNHRRSGTMRGKSPDDPRPQLEALISELAARRAIGWRDAAQLVRQALREVELGHRAFDDQLGRRDEARYRATEEGNTEGFATDPEPIPDAFREDEAAGN